MKALNLIPIHRRVAKQRRMHVRRCISICVVCGVASTLACVAAFAFSPGEDPTLQARLDRAEKDLAAATRSSDAAAAELNGVEMTLRATHAIADQPDWGVVLALLYKLGGPEIVLNRCEVTPIEAPAVFIDPVAAAKEAKEAAAKNAAPGHRPAKAIAKAPEAPKVRYTLTLNGTARSQFAVTQFVLRLEKTENLFDAVKLLDTSRQSLNNIDGVGFHIECTFDSTPAPAAAATPASMSGGAR